MDIRHLTLFSVLGTMMFAGKMVMAHIPNVEPVSLLVMLLAVCCGWRGLYAVAVYVLLEILVWGVNLWALSYLYVWALLFVAARLLWRMESSLSWGLLSGFLAGVRRPVRRSLLAHRRLGGRGFLVDIRDSMGPGPWDRQLCHGGFPVQASAESLDAAM